MQLTKFFTLLLIYSFLISACDYQNASQKHTDKIDAKHTIKLIIDGYWYESNYISNLQKTKSPYVSQNNLKEIVELAIDTADLIGDSLEVHAPSIHEGGSFTLRLKPGLTSTSFPTNIIDYNTKENFYELGYNITSNDTSLTIYHYTQNKKLIDQTQFLKAPRNTEGALQYMVNKTLIAGNYKIINPSNQVKEMNFSNDGIVKGLSGYATYYVSTDFSGPLNNLDQIGFAPESKNPLWFVFSINGDTLNLYDSKENKDHVTLERGNIKLKLLKY